MALLPRSLSLSIDALARQSVGKDWGMYSLLLERWRDIVGETYAAQTTPVKISFPRGKPSDEKWASNRRTDGVLHIRIPAGLSMSFSFDTDRIRQRIADCFGYPVIERIVLEPFYPDHKDADPFRLPPKPLTKGQKQALDDQLKSIDNEELRDILHQLGESVIKHG